MKNNTNKALALAPFGLSIAAATEIGEIMLIGLGIIATAISIALSVRNFIEKVKNEKDYKIALEELQAEIEREYKKWNKE